MKKIVNVSLLAVVLSSSIAAATAAPRSATVSLGGGTVAPHATFQLPVTGLMPSVQYDITCHINNPSKTDNVIMKFSNNGYMPMNYGYFRINGNLPNGLRSYAQAPLHPGDNVAIDTGMYASINAGSGVKSVDFTNIDNDIAVTVSNCVANPTIPG